MLNVKSTADEEIKNSSKVLLYANAGWGKTTQAVHYKNTYGKGLVLSAESGLRTLMKESIDYITITSWNDPSDESEGRYSFRRACELINEPSFRATKYNWIMLDSLSELSDMLLNHLEREYEGSKNKLAMWGEYGRLLIGACKWFRDLPYHIIVTCLVKSSEDENGDTAKMPLVKGATTQQSLTGIFDYVFAGVRADVDGTVRRYVVTDETRGYVAKARDPNRRLRPIEETPNVVSLLNRIGMDDDEFNEFMNAMNPVKESKE